MTAEVETAQNLCLHSRYFPHFSTAPNADKTQLPGWLHPAGFTVLHVWETAKPHGGRRAWRNSPSLDSGVSLCANRCLLERQRPGLTFHVGRRVTPSDNICIHHPSWTLPAVLINFERKNVLRRPVHLNQRKITTSTRRKRMRVSNHSANRNWCHVPFFPGRKTERRLKPHRPYFSTGGRKAWTWAVHKIYPGMRPVSPASNI